MCVSVRRRRVVSDLHWTMIMTVVMPMIMAVAGFVIVRRHGRSCPNRVRRWHSTEVAVDHVDQILDGALLCGRGLRFGRHDMMSDLVFQHLGHQAV